MGMDIALSNNANYGNLVDSCEEDYGLSLKAIRHHTSFKAGRESARFVAVTGMCKFCVYTYTCIYMFLSSEN